IPCIGYADVVKGFSSDTGKNFGYNSIFWYPEKGGISRLPLAFEKEIGRIGKNCDIDKIDLRNKEVEIKGKGKNKFDVLIMTAPLPELLKIVIPLPPDVEKALKKLRWNSIFNLNIGMEGECQKGKHWIYFPHKNTVFFRAGFFHNFSKNLAPRGKSSLYAEISYSADKPLDKKEAVRKALGGLKEAGVITGKNKVLTLDTNDIKYGYPIYDRNYQKATSTIKNFLSFHGIIACGRYGSWQYMSMEDAILEGKKVAEGISL
ncbi:MAG: FAD-dependent oxidoreductase, partial [Candidatus Omnitrophota bacterium]